MVHFLSLALAIAVLGASAFQQKIVHCAFCRHYAKNLQKSTSVLFLSSKPSSSSKTQVVYQKVVKNPSGNGNPFFLGSLVEYLQDKFDLPNKLPMVYESVYQNSQDKEGERCIQSWDSPMSPSPELTRLDLEVVAMFTDDDSKKDQVSSPSMAMVVVRKAKSQSAKSLMPSPMMLNFFQESEKLILRALDRGLDDFIAGKIPIDDFNTPRHPYKQSLDHAQDAMIEEMLEEAAESHPSVVAQEDAAPRISNQQTETKKNQILDADFSRVSKSKEEKPVPKAPPHTDVGLDYAVKAAKLAAKRRDNEKKKATKPTTEKPSAEKKRNAGSVDFAVAAAEKIARERKAKMKASSPKSTAASPKSKKVLASAQSTRSAPDQPRTFRTTFSTPEMFAAKMKQEAESKVKSKSKPIVQSKDKKVKGLSSKDSKVPSSPLDDASKQDGQTKKFKINLGQPFDPEKAAEEYPQTKQSGADSKTKTVDSDSKTPSDQEIMKTAQEVMAELADQQSDMTAEELLQDVLKFGEQQEQQNQVGSGFVEGAFDKAKELLREHRRQRDERAAASEVKFMAPETVSVTREPQTKTRVVSSEEEELRRMFEAGERIADGRISLVTEEKTQGIQRNVGAKAAQEQREVDELIARDKTISDHARVLDDELVELQVRINASPDSNLDGPPKNPFFDIMSGPEVYNPNVDPETTVNWPGALPGTKTNVENTLPKELAEALKQAKFAVEVLQNMEVRGEPESDARRYFVGNKELTERQVENLQTVVEEAIEIGIIQNPLVLMEERSRLQMVLDEMWNQPDERLREISSNFKDLLLSDNFATLVQERLEAMAGRDLEWIRQRTTDDDVNVEMEQAHARERELLSRLVNSAQLLLKEARALGAELEAQHIEVIRSICKVAMDPSHISEQETAEALTDVVRDMRPLFDEMFISYLKYAIAEEEGRLARAGLLDDPEYNQWLFVLKIVQQGVYAEIAKGINRYIEHIWYVLRMETPEERKLLLEKLVDVMPTLDVRPFVRVVNNIVASLGEAVRGDFDGAYELGKMANKLLQLHRDLKDILPPERINEMSRDADEWAATRRQQMMEQRKLTQQRLAAARNTEEYDEEIESIGRRGEMERF